MNLFSNRTLCFISLSLVLLLPFFLSCIRSIDTNTPHSYLQTNYFLVETNYFNNNLAVFMEGSATEGNLSFEYIYGFNGGHQFSGRYSIDTLCTTLSIMVDSIHKENPALPDLLIEESSWWNSYGMFVSQSGELELPTGPYHIPARDCNQEGIYLESGDEEGWVTFTRIEKTVYDEIALPLLAQEEHMTENPDGVLTLPLDFHRHQYFQEDGSPYYAVVLLSISNHGLSSYIPAMNADKSGILHLRQVVSLSDPSNPIQIYYPLAPKLNEGTTIQASLILIKSFEDCPFSLDGDWGRPDPDDVSGKIAPGYYCIRAFEVCKEANSYRQALERLGMIPTDEYYSDSPYIVQRWIKESGAYIPQFAVSYHIE
jgi:hypothetical protein